MDRMYKFHISACFIMKYIKKIISKLKGGHPLTSSAPLKYIHLIILLAAIQIYLSACATTMTNRSEVIPIDQFPDFIVSDGPDISTISGIHSIQDVDILGLTDHMKRIMDESVSNIKNKKKRLEALVEIALKNVRLDISEDTYGAKTAAETFKTGTGNCLSFSNLIVALGRYVGLDIGFEEIPTPPNWVKNGEVLFFTRHIGVRINMPYPGILSPNIIELRRGERFITWNSSRIKLIFIPFLQGSSGHLVDLYSSRSIPDNRAFSQYYNNLGSMHLARGNISDAFRYFVKAIKVDAELSFLWSNLGAVYSRNNQAEVAERVFFNALAINQDRDKLSSMTIMGNLARLYVKQGRMEDSAIYEEKVRSYRNRNPYYHYALGETAFYENQYEKSIEHFKMAIDRKADESQFHFALALAYHQLGSIKKADKSLGKAISYAQDKEAKEYYSQIRKSFTESSILSN